MPETLFNSDLESLPLVGRGKVRDIYGVGEDHLLIVTTDRLSALDVVLPTAIPGKGLRFSLRLPLQREQLDRGGQAHRLRRRGR